MRWAVLTVLMVFWDGCVEIPLVLERDKEAGFAVVTESERLSAAGSMSGMTTTGVEPAGCAWLSYGRRRPIRRKLVCGSCKNVYSDMDEP